jgi:hypothetical protein
MVAGRMVADITFSPVQTAALTRNFPMAGLLVQDLQEFSHTLEWLLIPLASIDYAIAVALQRFRFGLALPAGQERHGDGLRSDVEPHDSDVCNRA